VRHKVKVVAALKHHGTVKVKLSHSLHFGTIKN